MVYDNAIFLYNVIKRIEYEIDRPLNNNERQSVRDMITKTIRNYRFDPNLITPLSKLPNATLITMFANKWISI